MQIQINIYCCRLLLVTQCQMLLNSLLSLTWFGILFRSRISRLSLIPSGSSTTVGTPPDSITSYVVAAALLYIPGSTNYLHVHCMFPICCSHLIRLHSRNADYIEGTNLRYVWCQGDVQCITGHCSKVIKDKQTHTENRQHSTPLFYFWTPANKNRWFLTRHSKLPTVNV